MNKMALKNSQIIITDKTFELKITFWKMEANNLKRQTKHPDIPWQKYIYTIHRLSMFQDISETKWPVESLIIHLNII